MTGDSVIMGTRGPKEYAAGECYVARQRFLHHLRCRRARVLQSIVDSDIRASRLHDSSRLHDLRIRRARVRQKAVDLDLRASKPRLARLGAGG